jgi:DNA polymerase III delta prime subunit
MRRIPRATWIAVGVTGIITMLLSLLGNIGAAALTWLSPQLALLFFVLISLASIAISLWQVRQKAASEPSAAELREYREITLDRVQNTWITGFLENRLYYSYNEQLLPLPLRERVGSRFDLVLSNPLEPTQIIPSDTTIIQVFDQAGGELLILGEPGAGKTTLLLELARDLLKRAEDNKKAAIPVVLMLSSWATRKLPLEQWIAEELKAKYDIPSQIGREWVRANQLLLLLDGLDEVAPSALPACIAAINEYYHQVHRTLAVCSRTKEFLDQPGRLALHAAVTIHPLVSEQIDTYLDALTAKGEDVLGLKHTLHQSEELRALATTPLFLTVLILAYHGKPVQELLTLVKAVPTEQQHLLFHSYIERVLQHRGKRRQATAQQTKRWLGWLARQMTEKSQSELYLKDFQSNWLPKRQRAFYQWSIGLIFGLIFVLVTGPTSGLGAELAYGPIYGPSFRLVFGLIFGLLCGLVGGLLFGLGSGSEAETDSKEKSSVVFGMFTCSRELLLATLGLFIIGGMVCGLIRGLGAVVIGRLMVSGQFSVLGGALIGGLGVLLTSVLGFGLTGVLVFGLSTTIQSPILRLWLWQARCTPAPWRYVAFLDDTVEQLLLRKVGSGGYIFRHRLLQDYFASLDVIPPPDPSSSIEARSALQNAPNGDPSM